MDLNGAFDPLPNSTSHLGTNGYRDQDDAFEQGIAPPGCDPPTAHGKLGRYSYRWPYVGADGQLQGYQCRFDMADGKEFRSLRYGVRYGRLGWHWKDWADGRPLYRLPALAARWLQRRYGLDVRRARLIAGLGGRGL